MKRAGRVCPVIGCFEIVSSISRYCENCSAEKQKASNRKRSSKSRERYGKEWQRTRADYLMMQPNCVDCGRLAAEVDHIVPIDQGGSDDHTNLASRCKSCHSRKTARFDGGFGNPVVDRVSE